MQGMNRLERAKLAVRLTLLLALALGIAVADTVTNLEIAAGAFQIVVVLLAVSFLPPRAVVAVALLCMLLTALSYHLTRVGEPSAGLINCLISLATIACTSFLALRLSAAIRAVHQARAQLAHIARLNLLGELAASIAHEVNQPLAAMATSGNAGLRWLAAEPANLPKARQALQRIIDDSHRASAIIARVRGLAQRQPPSKQWLNVADTVNGILQLLRNELDQQGITLHLQLPDGLPPLLADPVQIQQVLLNLSMNAMEAMRTVGEDQRILGIAVEAQAGQLHFAVSDRGQGLAAADCERVFEAFYTTKPDGMGIGLAVSRSIIEAHEGRIWASVNAQVGATFHFSVPSADKDPE